MEDYFTLKKIVNTLIKGLPRDIKTYLKEGLRSANNKGNLTTGLEANIGRIYVTGIPEINCGNLIAGSFNGDRLVRDPIQNGESDLVYVGALPDSSKLYFGIKDECILFEQTIAPLHHKYDDSEYLLLNALSYIIISTQAYSGVAYLLTERIPCESCTHVINEFIRRFTGFSLYILYMFDSPNRNVSHFKNECVDSSRVKISYMQFSDVYSIDIIENS